VAAGGGLIAWRYGGKRVAFFKYHSAWAEYVAVSFTQVIEIADSLPFFKAVSAFANPFSVLSFIEIAQTAGCQAIIHTAGASTLGQMLIKHGKRHNISVIAVVRRDSQVEECKRLGAFAALDYTAPDFQQKLKEVAERTSATIAFDAVAGELTGTILSAMPNGSTVYVYGGLSEQRCVVGPRDLIFKRKTCDGFWLKDYLATKWTLGLYQWSSLVASQLDGDFASAIAGSFKLAQIHDAILAYSKDMGAGKIVLICDPTLNESS